MPEVNELPLVCQVDLDFIPDSPIDSLLEPDAEEAFVMEDNDIFSRPLASIAATVATFFEMVFKSNFLIQNRLFDCELNPT